MTLDLNGPLAHQLVNTAFTRKQLRALARKLGLPTGGYKGETIKHLLAADALRIKCSVRVK
jgi:hypothetical protein